MHPLTFSHTHTQASAIFTIVSTIENDTPVQEVAAPIVLPNIRRRGEGEVDEARRREVITHTSRR